MRGQIVKHTTRVARTIAQFSDVCFLIHKLAEIVAGCDVEMQNFSGGIRGVISPVEA